MTPVIGELGDRLSIYLNDHLAGSTVGLDLARLLDGLAPTGDSRPR